MGKTKIPWCDYTINPIKGKCPVGCSYCYARRLYDRFKWNPEIRYTDPGFTIAEIESIKKPSRIFVGSTMELFWGWPEIWLRDTFTIIKQFPQHTYIFLTKCPQNLPKEWPDNCWVGVSATNHNELADKWGFMRQIKASVKFVSLEPLLNWADASHRGIYSEGIVNSGIQWLIIGCRTPMSKKTMCKREWVEEIINAADKADIPVFVKPPLSDIMNIHRQEFPILLDTGSSG